ncbi:5217_t:CDS:2 [Ambispora leptoticha]|uniref:5217_t:CDS:1 n=1 Tax=Ambispora leptoticha TaxID=144679 RepID=A0A9N9FAD7_9GLOM|nr:5217_t:CDS:2 [Ambispora leptoticha]
MQPTTNSQSTFNPISVIVPNGAIKGPTGDPNDGNGSTQCVIMTVAKDNTNYFKNRFK